MILPADRTLADFPRLNGETDDAPRIQRAVEACPSGVLYLPAGVYEIAQTVEITNACSLLMHKSAILRAVREIDFIVSMDCAVLWDKDLQKPGAPEDYNLFIRGGQFDGNGLASCLFLTRYHHFTLADTTCLNGKRFGLKVDGDDKFGYELVVNNLYCKTVIPGLAGNVGLHIEGGDSHYTDVVVVDYTVGFRLVNHAWANRLTRCHVWGGPVPPPAEGELPEMLKDSICFDINQGGNILRECYADTGAIGFRINASTQLLGCAYFSNPHFGLDNITCIDHVSGRLTVANSSFTKTAEHVEVYRGSGEQVIWQSNLLYGFPEDVQARFSATSADQITLRLA